MSTSDEFGKQNMSGGDVSSPTNEVPTDQVGDLGADHLDQAWPAAVATEPFTSRTDVRIGAGVLAVVILVAGLFVGGVFSSKQTVSQWWSANRSTVTHLRDDTTKFLLSAVVSDNTGATNSLAQVSSDLSLLAASNCPNKKVSRGISALRASVETLKSDLQTSGISNLKASFESDWHSLFVGYSVLGSGLRSALSGIAVGTDPLPLNFLRDLLAHFERPAACAADAKTVETAISAYDATNTLPIALESHITLGDPSTYSHGTEAQKLISAQFLSRWPSDTNGYAISVSTTKAGDVSIYVPANSAIPVDFESETGTTGCNAL